MIPRLVFLHRVFAVDIGQQHQHPEHELVIVRSGTYRAFAEGRRWEAHAGQAICWPAGVVHQPRIADEPVDRLVCRWLGDPPMSSAACVDDTRGRLLALASWMWELDANAYADSDMLRPHVLTCLIMELVQRHRYGDASAAPLLERIIRDNIRRALPLSTLAAASGLSVRALHDRVREEHGVSPQCFVRNMRIARARELLEQSDLPLKAVAQAVGAGSAALLSRWISTAYGCAPSTIRRRAQRATPPSMPSS